MQEFLCTSNQKSLLSPFQQASSTSLAEEPNLCTIFSYVPNRGRNAVPPKMQNGQYWPFHKTSDPERGRTSDLQNEVGRQRVASGALSPDSKLYQMHVSISPFPNRTGEFPRIRLSKGPAFALGRLNDRKRTMNKNNRHRTTLRVVVCAACLSALLPSRGVHWTCY